MTDAYTVLIADDDIQIRRGIQKILTDHFSGTFTLLTAENGLTAMRLLDENRVDLLITDIKMPLYTGIDLIERIEQKQLPTQSIVLSGFQDYALVRAAMKHGAADYLLKPLDLPDFVRLIRSTLLTLMHTHAAMPPATLHWTSREQQQLIQLLNDSALPDLLSFYRAHAIAADDTAGLMLFSRTTSRRSLSCEDYLDLMRGVLSAYPALRYACGMTRRHVVLCLFCTGSAPSDAHTLLDDLHSLSFGGIRSTGLPQYIRADEILPLYQSLRKQTEGWFYDLPPSCTPQAFDRPEAYMPLITQDALSGKNTDAVLHLRELFDLIQQSKTDYDTICRIFYDLFDEIMQKEPAFIRILGKHKLTEIDLPTVISESDSLSVLRARLSEAIYVYIQDYRAQCSTQDEHMIREAKAYIEAHYPDNLQLSDVAEHVHLHPNYFSSVFAAKTGTPFRVYLRKIRIDHAQMLLRTTEQKIYEVADAVGYKETAHFNRAFKEVTGQSPHQYKMRNSQ